MTYKMPSTVSEVSAMLVDTMHLRVPSGARSKILACGRGVQTQGNTGLAALCPSRRLLQQNGTLRNMKVG